PSVRIFNTRSCGIVRTAQVGLEQRLDGRTNDAAAMRQSVRGEGGAAAIYRVVIARSGIEEVDGESTTGACTGRIEENGPSPSRGRPDQGHRENERENSFPKHQTAS